MHRPPRVRRVLALLLLAALPALAQSPAAASPPWIHAGPGASGLPAQAPGSLPVSQAPAPSRNAADAEYATPPPATRQSQIFAAKGPPPTQEEIADSLQAQRHYQAAIAAYGKIGHPSASVWNKMGIAYQMMFNLKDAQRCYLQSLKLDRRNATVMNNLATVYDASKDYKKAEKLYRRALKTGPRSALIFKNLGTNLLVQRKYSKGWKAYQEAATIDPEIFHEQSGPRAENPASIQQRGAMNYYMARGCLHSGQAGCAIQYLRMALNEGFTNAKKLASDSDFFALRDNPAFQELLSEEQQREKQAKSQHP
jgi:tetratricopeptide (TPR) repeat protein